MRIYINPFTRKVVGSVDTTRPVDLLTFKRRDRLPLEVVFSDGREEVELTVGTTGAVGLKERGNYSATALAMAAAWTPGDGMYTFDLNLHTTEMTAAFVARITEGMEPGMLEAMLEVEWRLGGMIVTTDTVLVEVQNDIVTGTEGVPASPDGGLGTVVPHMRLDITGLTGGTADKLDAVPVSALPKPYVMWVLLSSGLTPFVLSATTETADGTWVVRPPDYHAVTQPYQWRRQG
jgi:hypothetical protein